jgi:hypothetical protein
MRGQCHAPAALYPEERPDTHCTGGWMGPRGGVNRCGKSRPHRDSIPGPSSPSRSLYQLSYPAHFTLRPWYKIILHFYPVSQKSLIFKIQLYNSQVTRSQLYFGSSFRLKMLNRIKLNCNQTESDVDVIKLAVSVWIYRYTLHIDGSHAVHATKAHLRMEV